MHASWIFAAVALLASCRKEIPASSREAGTVASAATPADAAAGSTDDLARATLAKARVPGLALAVVRGGRVAECKSFGEADVTDKRPVDDATIFHVASLGKPVVGMSVMQLVEQGKLALDEDVSTRLPFAVRNPAHPKVPITLRRLLTHTSSIQDDFDAMHGASAAGSPKMDLRPFLEQYVTSRKSKRAVFFEDAPGTREAYSNVGTALAALVVESIAKERFGVYAKRSIFDPLRVRAAFRVGELPAEHVAAPHVWRGGGGFERKPIVERPVYPASDLRSSACDVGRLLAAVQNGGTLDGATVLSPRSVDAMLTEESLKNGRRAALGWQSLRVGDHDVLGHEGEDQGVSAVMALDRGRGVGAVVAANGDAFSSEDKSRARAIAALLEALLAAR